MPAKIPPPPREELRKMYEDEQMSQVDIAEHYKVHRLIIRRWLDEEGIPRRTLAEAISLIPRKPKLSKEELERMYIDEQMSQKDIAEEYNLLSSTVGRWLDYYEIKKRSNKEVTHLTHEKQAPPKAELEKMYVGERMSAVRIAEHYKVTHLTVGRWLSKHKIQRRSNEEATRLAHEKQAPKKEELEQVYLIDKMSTKDIEVKYSIGISTFYRWLDRYGILRKTKNRKEKLKPSKEELERMYVEGKMSQQAIANYYNVTTKRVIAWLDGHKIKRRTKSEAARLARGKQRPPKEDLERMYIKEQMSQRAIARYYEIHSTTAKKWLQQAGILEDQPSKSQQLEDLLTEYIGGEQDA